MQNLLLAPVQASHLGHGSHHTPALPNQMGNVSKAITTNTKIAKAWELLPSLKIELILVIVITTLLSAIMLTSAKEKS